MGSIISLFDFLKGPNRETASARNPESWVEEFEAKNSLRQTIKISNHAWIVLTQARQGSAPHRPAPRMEAEAMNLFKRVEFLCANPDKGRLKDLCESSNQIRKDFALKFPSNVFHVLRTARWEIQHALKEDLNDTAKNILEMASSLLFYEINLLDPSQTKRRTWQLSPYKTTGELRNELIQKAALQKKRIALAAGTLIACGILYQLLAPIVRQCLSSIPSSSDLGTLFNPPKSIPVDKSHSLWKKFLDSLPSFALPSTTPLSKPRSKPHVDPNPPVSPARPRKPSSRAPSKNKNVPPKPIDPDVPRSSKMGKKDPQKVMDVPTDGSLIVSKEEDLLEQASPSRTYSTEMETLSHEFFSGNIDEALNQLGRYSDQEKLNAFSALINEIQFEDLKKTKDLLEETIENELSPPVRRSIYEQLHQKYINLGCYNDELRLSGTLSSLPLSGESDRPWIRYERDSLEKLLDTAHFLPKQLAELKNEMARTPPHSLYIWFQPDDLSEIFLSVLKVKESL